MSNNMPLQPTPPNAIQSTQPDSKPRCLTPDCNRKRKCRGLCSICYYTANQMVQKGIVTWDGLIEMGLALPSGRERSSPNAFMRAVAQRLREADQPAAEPEAGQPITLNSRKPIVLPWKRNAP